MTDVLAVIAEGPDTLRSAARTHPRRVPGPGGRSRLHPGPAGHRQSGRSVRPAHLPADRPGCAGGQRGHLPGRRRRRQAPHRRDAVRVVYGFAMVDGRPPWPSSDLAPPLLPGGDGRVVRALRGAPGLVGYADSLTRLNRAKGMGTIMITHSLADLDALATEDDRAKARGFVERSAITVMGGLPPRELARVHEITPLTGPEQELVTSWSAPDSWQPGARHPGRGKYLIKTGERLGIPVELSLVGAEHALYDTDQAIRAGQSWGPDEPRHRAAAPLRRRQRRAGVGADRRRLGPDRPDVAGLGRRPARRPGRRPRPHPAVRHPVAPRRGCTAAPRRPGPAPPRPWSPSPAASSPSCWPASRPSPGASSPGA